MTTLMALTLLLLVFGAALAALFPPLITAVLSVMAYVSFLLRGPLKEKKKDRV